MTILSEILSSKSRAEFFRILFGVGLREFHLREIQRQSGLAIGTIKQESEKLHKIGLIIRRQDGNRVYFSANKEHPLYSTIHNLVLKTSGLADLLKKCLESEEIKFAFVFGSVAAGTETANSDVDLFVIGEIGLRVLSSFLKEPVSLIGREINPQLMSLQEFTRRKIDKEHFVTRVLESPKLMIIGSEDEFNQLGL